MRPTVDELRHAVEAAFADRPYPGDDRIADSHPRYADYEGHAVAHFHRGKAWREITLASLREEYAGDESACLAFMTPEGWRFYLPAYLLIALDWDEADALGDAVVGALTHPRDRAEAYARTALDLGLEPEDVLASQAARFEERTSGLREAEVAAIVAVLRYLERVIDVQDAGLGGLLPNDARVALGWWRAFGTGAGR